MNLGAEHALAIEFTTRACPVDRMNSKELVQAALRGDPVPRIPTGPLAVHFCAGVLGISVRQYTTHAASLAESVIRYYEKFQPDAVWVSADTWVSAEAMGAPLGLLDEHQPFAGSGIPLIRQPADLNHLSKADLGRGRYPLMLDALSRVVSAIGHEAFVVACFDQYPFSLASALLGINQIMLRVVDDLPGVQALMEHCLEYGLVYARALCQAGAHMLSGGDSPAGLLGPRLYEQVALPFAKRLISGLKRETAVPVSLHVCGNSTPLLPGMARSGADVLELDHAVDLAHACRAVGPRIALWGNLDPVALLAQGTPQMVADQARRVMDVAAICHARFVLSSGCTLAMETPPDNLRAMLAAPSNYSGFSKQPSP